MHPYVAQCIFQLSVADVTLRMGDVWPDAVAQCVELPAQNWSKVCTYAHIFF